MYPKVQTTTVASNTIGTSGRPTTVRALIGTSPNGSVAEMTA